MTDPTTRRSFIGIPVQGEINPGATRVEQWPIWKLAPLMQAVLNDPFIVEFGWTQYTPYFMDGDPCEFSVHQAWFRTKDDRADVDRWQLELDSHEVLKRRWDATLRKHVYDDLPYDKRATAERCQALDQAIQSGHFDNLLLENFGDHAEITVRRDGITIDFYSHD